jgi:hypothetical protein
MNKALKVLVIFLAVDAVAVGLYLGVKAVSGTKAESADQYSWVTVDENYVPRNSIEEFIKTDAAQQGLLPISLRNYGRNASVLKKFRGSNFAGPNEAVLEMVYPKLEDWMLVDLRYKNAKQRSIERTVLYVESGGQWKVADSGRLLK